MKAKSEGSPESFRGAGQNEECRSGEKLGSGIRAQSLGCRGLRQLWRNRAAVGRGRGAARRRGPASVVGGGCRWRAACPDRVRRPGSAWLPGEGRQALGTAWPQRAAPPMHRPAGKPLDQDWRGRNSIWVEDVGSEEVLNG